MESDLISICIPTFNNIKNLQKVIDSVLSQSFKNFEIIISDDSTNDETKDLVEKNISKGVSIQYFRNSPSLGSPKNWNYAMSKAKGRYIKILHHDDWLIHPKALELCIDQIKNDNKSFVFSSAETIRNGQLSNHIPDLEELEKLMNNPFYILKANFIGGPSSIIFPNNGIKFDERLIWLVDVDFYLQLFAASYRLKFISTKLYCTFLDDSNITNRCIDDYDLNIKELSIIYHKYKKLIKFTQRLYVIHLMNKYLSQVHATNFMKTYLKIVFGSFLKR